MESPEAWLLSLLRQELFIRHHNGVNVANVSCTDNCDFHLKPILSFPPLHRSEKFPFLAGNNTHVAIPSGLVQSKDILYVIPVHISGIIHLFTLSLYTAKIAIVSTVRIHLFMLYY